MVRGRTARRGGDGVCGTGGVSVVSGWRRGWGCGRVFGCGCGLVWFGWESVWLRTMGGERFGRGRITRVRGSEEERCKRAEMK